MADRVLPSPEADESWIVAHHHHNPADFAHTIDHYSEERCGLDAFNIPRCYAVHDEMERR